VASLWLIDKGGLEELVWAPIAWRDSRGQLVYTDDVAPLARMRRRLGLGEQSLLLEWRQHEERLAACYESGRRSEAAVREAVLAFYAESALRR
jgi:hypothetical protein